jgi:hypothetical protein
VHTEVRAFIADPVGVVSVAEFFDAWAGRCLGYCLEKDFDREHWRKLAAEEASRLAGR